MDKRLMTGGVSLIGDAYRVWLCDIWGVVHNGLEPFDAAVAALQAYRRQGGFVALISNAARPAASIQAHMDEMGIPRDAYDAIVTSGDVTRHLITGDGLRRIYRLGPDRDAALYEGLEVACVGLEDAQAVVCTGLVDDETETVDDYRDLLARFRERDLTFYCANPDIVVRRGDTLYACAGALAEIYGSLGGRVVIGGKPHPPIYDKVLNDLRGSHSIDAGRSEILVIGDGMGTDMTGAAGQGFDALFIIGGIHADELAAGADDGDRQDDAVRRLDAVDGLRLKGVMPHLFW